MNWFVTGTSFHLVLKYRSKTSPFGTHVPNTSIKLIKYRAHTLFSNIYTFNPRRATWGALDA